MNLPCRRASPLSGNSVFTRVLNAIARPGRTAGARVSAHQKKGIWCAIVKKVWTLSVCSRQSTHCCKQWDDLRRWAQKMEEAQLGVASQ
ncbi:hypothetical protein NDU88_007933 [Pleurodeles waltl]|uniref:Uncharacterized protein n=1 Tax=Pleurodeles waltl TaxID=8319 RepID=A0AAV7RTA9_PLEWA|nr:hypothetical protein NDU88_007933 [Pleurodeles waltl]